MKRSQTLTTGTTECGTNLLDAARGRKAIAASIVVALQVEKEFVNVAR